MSENRLTNWIRRYRNWFREIEAAVEGDDEVAETKALVMDYDGEHITVVVHHETKDGYLCNKERTPMWYVMWPLCSDPLMNKKWFVRRDDPRILSITNCDAVF